MAIYKTVFFGACIWGICALTAPSDVSAQAMAVLEPTIEIPRDYKSWSLFLVCNPAWIIKNGDKGLAELYYQFKAFGRVIGNKNLAIWFWKHRAGQVEADNTDIDRSGVYCERYKRRASESPLVLVTTKYPDDQNPGDHFVVRLNDLDAHRSALALTKLADQLLVEGLNQSDLDMNSSDGWRRLLGGVRSAMTASGCYFNTVSFSFKTSAVNAEIAPSTGKGC